MQFLIDFATSDEEFQQILGRATEYDTVQGVVLDIDRFWLRAWQLRERWGDDRVNAWLNIMGGKSWFGVLPPELATGGIIFSRPPTQTDVENWRPNRWQNLQEQVGENPKGLPLVVKVCLRPARSPDDKFPNIEALRSVRPRKP